MFPVITKTCEWECYMCSQFFPMLKKKAGLQANESWSQNILIVIVLIKANFSALLVSAARHISFLNCTYSNGEVTGFK